MTLHGQSLCHRCKGGGRVTTPEPDPSWRERGRACRKAREGKESMGDVARRLGISVVLVSDMECGEADPALLEEALRG